jgi:Rieske 2Fe-2S family protein
MMDYISKEEYALFRVWVESWQGFIYVNLAPAQPVTSLGDMLAGAGPVLQRFRLEHAKIAKTIVYDVPANWKLFMENYRECYHCLSNHPQFCGTVPVGRTSLYRAVSDCRVIQAANLTFSRYPLRPGARTPSISGELVSIPFGDVGVADQGFLYALNFYPGHAFAFGIDHGMAFSLHPQSATQSLLKVDWYVSDEAVEGKDYDVANVIAFWDVTHRQDIELCAINQQGVNSRRYVPGPYSPNEEDEINHLMNFYVNALTAGE